MPKIKGLDAIRCSNCGKTLLPMFEKKWFLGPQVVKGYPPGQIPDTFGAVCACGAALCHECFWTRGVELCPACQGRYPLVGIQREDG